MEGVGFGAEAKGADGVDGGVAGGIKRPALAGFERRPLEKPPNLEVEGVDGGVAGAGCSVGYGIWKPCSAADGHKRALYCF